MGTPVQPYRIDPPTREDSPRGRTAKERSRNRLTVNYISDGTPMPRCELRPLDERATWLLEHRPYHIADHYDFFGLCINVATCDECPIRRKHINA